MITNASVESRFKKKPTRRCASGFSLLEMSMVLVIIGVIMSAVMIGTDLLRHAKGQNAFSSFVVGWSEAFAQYTRATGNLPGFPAPATNNLIDSRVDTFLCGASLVGSFGQASIRIPAGMGNGLEDQYRYQASDGSPRTLSVCLVSANWGVRQVDSAGIVTYPVANRHLLRIVGLTPELAIQLDTLIDGNPDARFGRFRESGPHVSANPASVPWTAIASAGAVQPNVTAFLELQ
ncbi:type II secretion system protein [Hydrogenophaga sp.]|uniref:type II secretion system protein n=1 Tax=Hydrogenophaga sp. TaxID=1904254 RepID=UPI003F727655